MAALGPLLTARLTMINIGLAVRTWWLARRDRRQPPAHPLEAALRDIAQAVRESGGQT